MKEDINCFNIIAYSISLIGVFFEIYGIYKTYKLRSVDPDKIEKSRIQSDNRVLTTSAIFANMEHNIERSKVKYSVIEKELNRIVDQYNKSVADTMKSNKDYNEKSSRYFLWILRGFILQAVAVCVFLIQEFL